MYIDTHCHLSSEYYDNIYSVIDENRINSINKIIVSGCELNNMKEVISIARDNYDIFLTIGFHPSEADTIGNDDMSYLRRLIELEKIVAIGEIGLDYHYGNDNKLRQQEIFRMQLSLAKEFNLPVVIHSRDATLDTINILKEYSLYGVIHCFSGSVETALEYVKMGYKIGIGGVLTFKNSNLYKVVDKLKLEDIVLETDAPYLTPAPYRGKINSSKYIPVIAESVANIKNIDILKVAKVTTETAERLFDI